MIAFSVDTVIFGCRDEFNLARELSNHRTRGIEGFHDTGPLLLKHTLYILAFAHLHFLFLAEGYPQAAHLFF